MAEFTFYEQQQLTAGLTQEQKNYFQARYAAESKDRTTLLIVSIFLGKLGVDRFMMDDVGMGLLKLFTLGCCGVLWIIDICTITDRVDAYNRRKAAEIIAALHQAQAVPPAIAPPPTV
jgi:TM2 domain-containing membrane protein YozV